MVQVQYYTTATDKPVTVCKPSVQYYTDNNWYTGYQQFVAAGVHTPASVLQSLKEWRLLLISDW